MSQKDRTLGKRTYQNSAQEATALEAVKDASPSTGGAGAAEAAERYLLESSVAAAAVQKRLLRQRLVCWHGCDEYCMNAPGA